jgi:hypothetical protein
LVGQELVVLGPAGHCDLADQIAASELFQDGCELVAVGLGDLVEAVEEESQPTAAQPGAAHCGWDAVPGVELDEEPADEAGQVRAVEWVVVGGARRVGRPAGQVDQDRDRLALIRVSLLGEGAGKVEEQSGLAGAWCAQDQHGVLELVEDGGDVLVVGDVLGCTVEWLDQQVVRADHCVGAFVDSECDSGAAGQ